MKKLTAFFMALMPLLVTILLFAAGLIVKNSTHVYVQSVELGQNSLSIQKKPNEEKHYQMEYSVLPQNATNPEIYWLSSNENIVEVDKEGQLTFKSYGEAYITAYSKENNQKKDTCKVEVWDDQFHSIQVNNQFDASYVGLYQSVKINANGMPQGHIKDDPSLTYTSSNPDIISVAPDGEMTAKATSETPVTITIASKTWPNVKNTINVKAGAGVYLMGFKEPTNTTITSSKINLLDKFETYPDKDTVKDPNQFTFESSNKEVATVNEKGEVNYLKPGKSEFSVTYKREKSLVSKKTIESTCQFLKDVSFNRYDFETEFTESRYIKDDEINWYVYPETADLSNLKIESSNTSVVSVDKDRKFKIEGPGVTVLTATINDGNEGIIKQDKCLVTITKPISGSFLLSNNVTTKDGSYYYSIRDNIDYSKFYTKNQTIEFKLIKDEKQVSTLDAQNGIVHFKDAGTVTLQVTIDDKSENFDLTSEGNENALSHNESKITLQVGKKYYFSSNWYADFTADQKDKFDISEDGTYFIPKFGAKLSEVTVRHFLRLPRTIELDIEEKPIEIKFNSSFPQFYVTANKEVNFKQLANPILLPYNFSTNETTATDKDGNLLKINNKYTLDKSATQKDDIITFNQEGYAEIESQVEGLDSVYFWIHSTFGKTGKFSLVDKDNKHYFSGSKIELVNGQEIELSVENLFSGTVITKDIWDQFTIYSVNGNNICELTKEAFVEASPTLKFKIKSLGYGNDVVAIKSSTFVLYLNINSGAKILDFITLCQGQLLDATNTSYTKKLKIQVFPYPLSALSITYTAKFNGVEVTPTLGLIDLSTQTWQEQNTLSLEATNDDGSVVKREYTITYKENIDDFNIVESTDNKNLYIKCNETSSISTISFGGFVDESIYSKLSVVAKQAKESEKYKISSNKLYINGIDKPSEQELGYERDFEITYKNSDTEIKKQYHISREIVSRIVLPKHDNLDPQDAKGLQKVRVFGHKSYWTADDGQPQFEFYYKLPIQMYDYQNKIISDLNGLAKKAFDSLKINVDNNCAIKYHSPEARNKTSFVEVVFDQNNLYNPDDIYGDKFAEQNNKNVHLSIQTPTISTQAKYTFAPVNAVNIYDQIGMYACCKDKEIVIHNNYAKEGTTKDNVPLDNINIADFNTIYGNGYTINFDTIAKTTETTHKINLLRCFNINIQGMNSKDMKEDSDFQIQTRNHEYSIDEKNRKIAYSTFNFVPKGLNLSMDDDRTCYIKKTLFHDNQLCSINIQNSSNSLYLEDSIFFNCSSFAINAAKGANIYLKGFIDCYNFRGEEMFKNIEGMDLRAILWPRVQEEATKQKIIQKSYDGKPVLNSFMDVLLSANTYFWDESQNKYVLNDKGNPAAANHLRKFWTVKIPVLGEIALWSSLNPDIEKGAPSYYDEYDENGQLRVDFLNKQIEKITRKVTPIF